MTTGRFRRGDGPVATPLPFYAQPLFQQLREEQSRSRLFAVCR